MLKCIFTLTAFPSSSSSSIHENPKFSNLSPFHMHNWWESDGDGSGIDHYLEVVDHMIQLTKVSRLDELGETSHGDVADRAESILQSAMARLEDEFRYTLIRNTILLDTDHIDSSLMRRSFLSSASSDGIIHGIPSFDSSAGNLDPNEEISDRYHRRVTGASLGGDDLFHDLVNPDAIIDLREIASRRIRARYEKECCQVYSSVCREILDECMLIIGVKKLSIEEVQRMDWKSLDEKMKNWIRALKIVVRVLLTGENLLCKEIFSGSDVVIIIVEMLYWVIIIVVIICINVKSYL